MDSAPHILLADDDEDDIFMFQSIINDMKTSIAITVAQDGIECINFIKKRETPYDLLFLDINMPKSDGFSCLRAIRQLESYLKTPVIMLSTASDDRTIKAAYSLGATRYISKSCDYGQLKESIQKAVRDYGH